MTLPANSISRVANLSVAIEQTPATLTVGQPGQLVVRVTNAGPDPSTGANINVTSGILVVTGYGPSQGTVAGQTWMTQSIASGGQATLVVNLSSPTAGTGTLNAEVVTAAEADPNSTPGNHLPTEDDQKTVQIAVLPPVPPVNPPPVPPVRQLPSGLTLSGTRVRNVVTLTGALGVPAGGTCGGTILAAARIAGQVRSTHTNLRQSASGCTYKTRLRLPGRGRGRVRATVIFTGNGTLLPIASSQLRVP